MHRSTRPRAALVAFGLLTLVAALHPACAVAEAAKPAPYAFKICRIPGADAAIGDQTIVIPAGTEFDANHSSDDDPLHANDDPTRSMAFVTIAGASLPADGFCVAVPVKPRGGIDAEAIRHGLGGIYEPVGNWHGAANAPVTSTYGYWQATGE
jgi:hypothetical protein